MHAATLALYERGLSDVNRCIQCNVDVRVYGTTVLVEADSTCTEIDCLALSKISRARRLTHLDVIRI